MKYIITESQIDKFIFRYINLKNFIKIKKGDDIYFVKSEDDEYAQIKYDGRYDLCVVHVELLEDISTFFSLHTAVSRSVIGRWVEHKLFLETPIKSVINLWVKNNTELLIPE
jgi:hypothetical protein